jgi:hypothetical protein
MRSPHVATRGRLKAPDRLAAAVPRPWRWPIVGVLMAVALAYAFWSLHARVRPWNDFAFVYAAGRTWLEGLSPYDFDRWDAQWVAIRPADTVVSQPMSYMYPPHWGPLAVLLAEMPWPVASRFWDGFSIVAYAATVALCVRLLGGRWPDALRQPALWLFIALATLNPSLRYSIWQSQMTTFTAFGVVGAYWAWHEKRLGWLVVFAFVAALKPQLSLLALLYLFLNGGHVGVALAAIAALVVSAVSMLPSGLENLPGQYAHCYALHMQLVFNDPKNFSNLPALFFSRSSQHAFMPVSTLLAVAAATGLTLARRVDSRPFPVLESPLWQLAIVAAITAALMPVHAYDLVIYTPVVILAYELRASWIGALLVGLVLFAGRPGFVAAHLHLQQASSYLTTAILLTLALAVANRRRDPSVAAPAAEAAA